MCDSAAEDLPDDLPKCLPDDLPHCLSDDLPHCLPDALPKCLSDDLPKCLSDDLPKCLSDDVPHQVREAAALQEKLLGLLVAPPPQGARTGILFQKWRDVSMRVDANGHALSPAVSPKYVYLFFCKYLPAACRLYLAAGHPLPPLFQQRLNEPPSFLAINRNGDGHIDRAEWNAAFPKENSLRLTAWEYYLFLFCQWPLSPAGEVTTHDR